MGESIGNYEAALASITQPQREFLAIISKLPVITNQMISDSNFSSSSISDLNELMNRKLVSIQDHPEGIGIDIPKELEPHLKLEFLKLENSRRIEVCKTIATFYFSRHEQIKAFQTINSSGDKNLLTTALLTNVIEIHNVESADELLKLTDQMDASTPMNEFAQKCFKIASHIWRGEFLLSLSYLDEISGWIKQGKVPLNYAAAIDLLLAVTQHLMGRTKSSKETLEKIISSDLENTAIDATHIIQASRLYASIGLLELNDELVERAFRIASTFRDQSKSVFALFNYVQIESMKYFVEGRISLAYEKASTALDIACRSNYVGTQAPFEALYVKASCEEEMMNYTDAVKTWKTLASLAERFKIPAYVVIGEMRAASASINSEPFTDMAKVVTLQHEYVNSLPYRSEVDFLIDIEELSITASMNNWDRAADLLRRIPANPRSQEIAQLLEVRSGKKLSDRNGGVNTPRREIHNLLIYCENEELSDIKLEDILLRILDIAQENGYLRLLCTQPMRIKSVLIRMASEKSSPFSEKLFKVMRESAESSSDLANFMSVNLTKREREILTLLAIGYVREHICENLKITLNTFKTHQKNLYKKLQARNRSEAITNARALRLVS
jgi:DNA-binding CsgD family transcriptional regulator/tetratricopeptide (TPR) repeat protein